MMRASHVSRQIVSAALRVHIVVGILAVVPKAHPAVLAMGLTSRQFVVQEIVVRMTAAQTVYQGAMRTISVSLPGVRRMNKGGKGQSDQIGKDYRKIIA
jgi:hypothetical protein